MAPRTKPSAGPVPVDAIRHDDKRLNIPTADSEELLDESVATPAQLRWPRDSSLDPQLVWKGKDEQNGEDLVVDAPPIYIQEKIVPQVIIENLRRSNGQEQLDLFADFDGLSGYEAVEYYQHEANWSNRMILGDSLQVMASLAEKENLRGKVQMIYIDPPYGIDFKSNWQASTDSTNVTDGKVDHVTREVEQIQAFRDTWEKGINSYLAYLRDRLTAARDLLSDTGSVFVQIGDENTHIVRCLLDEVFGSRNFISQIAFAKTSGATGNYVPAVCDYLLWYGRDSEQTKYRALYRIKEVGGIGGDEYRFVELPDGTRLSATDASARGLAGRPYRLGDLTSQSVGRAKGEGAASWFPVELNGKQFLPPLQRRWSTNEAGMKKLALAGRLVARRSSLAYVRYLDDFQGMPYTSMWTDTVIAGRPGDKIYVVQTSPKVVERCLLMTTDPGDLVLDPTCGSGTTAFSAEQWGRRWITADTSRVALALARQRVMSARYPYYLLLDSRDGQQKEAEITGRIVSYDPSSSGSIRKGFVYERITRISLKSITVNPEIGEGKSRAQIDAAIAKNAETEILYDRPYEDTRKVRVAGRFTVESLSPHTTISPERPVSEKAADATDGSTFTRTILDNLLKAGVQNGRKKERLEFEMLSPFPGKFIQAEGSRRNGEAGTPQRIAVSIGPQFGTVDAEWIRHAARDATRGLGFDLLLVCAFAFDPQAVKATEEFAPSDGTSFATVQEERRLGKVPILLVRMNSDLAMGDVLLKKTGSANLFMVFGEPDVAIEQTPQGVVVEIRGVDVYNPTTGEIRSSGTGEIALWMIDTDYDGESFFVRHCYFTGTNDPYARLKRALKADIDEAAWESLYSTRSRPFERPSTGRIAVKVINHYGDEVLQVYDA
ncbi:MAG TPA: site-specific DNA-methyltransferase [Streptosporangiaceae bacterium]|nr:site-specific DNA-methyltransferase [Streptosporangiaceae bacterium]